ncbi:hypothetical protein FH972_011241 [Carpinus fangiana]|uniref:Uncharacterized protein n=1 Tax=Carpinus fangiana TaxID=176857 RepID=A0A660KTT4_9ROSI|nr:hypothetical protein FH972_011241 [Carpinus fangiana]
MSKTILGLEERIVPRGSERGRKTCKRGRLVAVEDPIRWQWKIRTLRRPHSDEGVVSTKASARPALVQESSVKASVLRDEGVVSAKASVRPPLPKSPYPPRDLQGFGVKFCRDWGREGDRRLGKMVLL